MPSNLCAKLETDQSTGGGSIGHNNVLARSFYRRFVYFEDTVTYFDKIVMFSHRGKQIDILKFI